VTFVFAIGGELNVMTIQAQLPDGPPAPSQRSDRPTAGIEARQPFIVDSFALLDHRTRDRSILAQVAPPGRYLSVEHDDQTRLIALERPITHIGRGLAADVRLEDPNVSRRHAIVALRGDGIRVLDDRSSNGTFVNGRPVTVAQLADGDVLRFGRVVLRYAEIAPRRKPQPLRRIPLARRDPRRDYHHTPAGAAA
jgi:FHA domain